jgi:hypothetical protein
MVTKITPQEIFLLERYVSADYFGELCDIWRRMISTVESSLETFMSNLPLDYRNRPQSEQPDVVWGERVLPNFRNTFQALCEGYLNLTDGKISGLDFCYGPLSDFKGQQDFWSGWMNSDDEDKYYELLILSTNMANNIRVTKEMLWEPSNLTNDYMPEVNGPLDPPVIWPSYRLNQKVKVRSGDVPQVNGVYLPMIDESCALFLCNEFGIAPEAKVLMGKTFSDDDDQAQNLIEEHECEWILVERSNSNEPYSTLENFTSYRVRAGERCPETGFYFTPAKSDSRRRFEDKEVMPEVSSDYGHTIWQWDPNQS